MKIKIYFLTFAMRKSWACNVLVVADTTNKTRVETSVPQIPRCFFFHIELFVSENK
jgi:hypothetical protein